MRNNFKYVLFLSTFLGGCSSITGFFLGEDEPVTSVSRAPSSEEIDTDNTGNVEREVKAEVIAATQNFGDTPSTSEFLQLSKQQNEQSRLGFRRKADLWEGVERGNEGSLWNSENQNNFYFTRNMIFGVGDLITLEFEPDISESLNSRIASLYKPSTKPSARDVIAEEAGKAAAEKVGAAVTDAVKNEAIGNALGEVAKDRAIASIATKKRYFTTREMTLRVTEVNTRGVLKLEGTKKLFLKNASFDLKVAGMLREEDITSGRRIATSQLLDAKFEVVK